MKFNLGNNVTNSDSQVTLTSYLSGEEDQQQNQQNQQSQPNQSPQNLHLNQINDNQPHSQRQQPEDTTINVGVDNPSFNAEDVANHSYLNIPNLQLESYQQKNKDNYDDVPEELPRRTRRDTCRNCSQSLSAPIYIPEECRARLRTSRPSIKEWAIEKSSKTFTKKSCFKRIPILTWLPNYNLDFGVSDLVAGITVGLTVIPQAIAYSNVAGLPPQVGLYSSFMACFVYTVFGSCKDSPIGPTAIMALLTKENNHGLGVDGAVLLCFLSGCVEFLMGVLQLGFLIDFISGPVSIGFTSAAAIIIATTQIKHILGLKIGGENFLDTWENIFEHLPETRLWDAILGLSCMIILFLLRGMKNIQIGPQDSKERSSMQNFLSRSIWLVSTARNIIVVLLGGLMAWIFELHDAKPFNLTGHVKPGLPQFKLPPFSTTVGNQTYNFAEMSSTLGSAVLVVPLLAILENIALAKVFSEGKAIDATQEMLAIGLCNIASSFTMSMPVTGALSRGAVNNASGVRTTFGGVYTGIIVILSLYFLTPYFYYIPKASLAAVIVAAVVFMVELHVVKPIWRTKKADLVPAIATFLSCLFLRLEIGILIGIGINLLFLLYSTARPSVHIEKVTSESGIEYLLITPDRSLVFPSVEYVRTMVTKAGVKQGFSSTPVVIDARHIQGADFTAAKGIKSLIEDFTKRHQPILFYNLKPSVINIFQGVQPKDFVYCNTYEGLDQQLEKCSNKELAVKM